MVWLASYATLLDRPVKMPPGKNSDESGKSSQRLDSMWNLKDEDACPRFCGRMISGVKIGPSSRLVKNSLATGIGL